MLRFRFARLPHSKLLTPVLLQSPISRSLTTGREEQLQSAVSSRDPERKDGHSGQKVKNKTMAELDEDLRMKLEGRSGDGGVAGIELENGKPVAMRRGVRENMFRLI